jgi:arylsulfatase A-like enzyme
LRLRAAALLLAALVFAPALLADPARHVLLFTVDSCRADRLGVYGGPAANTPHLDRWSASGAVFTQAYSVSAWTAPGLVSLLTGLYPGVHGVDNRDRTGSPQMVTLQRMFRKRGYLVPNLNFFTFAPYYRNLGLGEVDRQYLGTEESQALLNWLDQHAQGPDSPPFFVWFHTTLVHQPYRPPDPLLPAPRAELERSPGIRAVLNGAIVPRGSAEFGAEDRPVLEALYDAEVRHMDQFFGQVIELLAQRALLESTLIVFTADHGEELLDHGFVGHASTSLQAKLYEEVLHIPLIVSWPGRIAGGQVFFHPVSQVDVLPTICRLQGWHRPEGVQGRDLFEPEPDRALLFESVAAGNQTPKDREDEWVRGVRRGRFKYLEDGRLFDLLADPEETRNVAESFPGHTAQLRELLGEMCEENRRLSTQQFGDSPRAPLRHSSGSCPRIYTPEHGKTLDYEVHTGTLLFDWSGDMETAYVVEYDIGTGDHHVAGRYEVLGNHQIMGPFPRELWADLKAWNPFRIRVTPKQDEPCWSSWVEFRF